MWYTSNAKQKYIFNYVYWFLNERLVNIQFELKNEVPHTIMTKCKTFFLDGHDYAL